MIRDSEINALIQLLDDTDQEVSNHVYDKLISYGPEVIPTLEQAWDVELTPAALERLEEIIHDIQFDILVKEWKLWLSDSNPDLLTGVYLIAKYYYPDLSIDEIRKKILKIKQSIWLELNYNQTALEQIQIFNQIFYNYHSFKGVQLSNKFQDWCINQVLDNKQGSAVSIGILYQILANELNLPVYGVTLMQHYVLAFCKKMILDFSEQQHTEKEVMFYINPVNRGSVFSRNEIKDYLQRLNQESDEKFFIPAKNTDIINELIFYLISVNDVVKDVNKVRELGYLLELSKGNY